MIFPQNWVDRIALYIRRQSFPAAILNTTMGAVALWVCVGCAVVADTKTAGSSTATVTLPVDAPLPEGVDQSTGFRMQRYRSPVPDELPGAEVVDTRRALALLSAGDVVFIDVYPPTGLGPDPLEGHWVSNEKHRNIRGSIWLPEVGRGFIEQPHIDYFQRNLATATNDSNKVPLLFYCTADCWQSWNAARRAVLWGHENVFWYPEGTDGWQDNNQPLVAAQPVNFLGN